jgi:mediator of RNA polymerase II transcription subunit 5
VAGLGWFSNRLWETKSDAPQLDVLLPVLAKLVKPPSLSSESRPLHESVLFIVAPRLERSLAYVQRLHPRRKDIDPLLSTLKSHLRPRRVSSASISDLESWSRTANGGLIALLKHSMRSLTLWSTTGAHNTPPPAYSHKQILAAVQLHGASSILNVLLGEIAKPIVLSTNDAMANSGNVLLDIATALICAPVAPPVRASLSLRQALQVAYSDAYKISRDNPARAEAAVRLYRAVDAQSVHPEENDVQVAEAGDMMMQITGPEGADASGPAAGAAGEAAEVENGMGLGLDVDGLGGTGDMSGLEDVGAGVTEVDLEGMLKDVQGDGMNVDTFMAEGGAEDMFGL